MPTSKTVGDSPKRESEEQHIGHLHNVYQAGKLRILVGAGTSMDSGLPSWENLSLKLLEGWLESDDGRWSKPETSKQSEVAKTLYTALGRDGTTDFIASRVSRHEFRRLFSNALYGEHKLCEFRPRSVHKQLAVMSDKASLYTTNYDHLLELAMEELHHTSRGEHWRKFRDPQGYTYRSDDTAAALIHHLHGWIDPCTESSGPEYGGSFIITESHYLELPNYPDALANRRMQVLLETEGATLIMGMSMEDPNVRRMLYRLSRSGLDPISDLYVILKYEGQADRLINEYVADRWEQRKVTLLSVNSYDDLPSLLRHIHWGVPDQDTAPEIWLDTSIDWIEKQLQGVQFTDDWQIAAHCVLDAYCQQVQRWLGIPEEERITCALFVPMKLGPSKFILAPLASTRGLQTASQAKDYLNRKNVPLCGPDDLGAISAAFLLGKPREATRADTVRWDFPEPDAADKNSDYFKDRQSLLTIPVLDSKYWLPVAAVVITSSNKSRKWEQNLQDEDKQPWLFSSARKTANLLISNRGPA